MMRGVVTFLENHHKVRILDEGVEAAVRLAGLKILSISGLMVFTRPSTVSAESGSAVKWEGLYTFRPLPRTTFAGVSWAMTITSSYETSYLRRSAHCS